MAVHDRAGGSHVLAARCVLACAASAIIASFAGCAVVPATVRTFAAAEALEHAIAGCGAPCGGEQARGELLYDLTRARALLEKAREEAAEGHFESAEGLAAEAQVIALRVAGSHPRTHRPVAGQPAVRGGA